MKKLLPFLQHIAINSAVVGLLFANFSSILHVSVDYQPSTDLQTVGTISAVSAQGSEDESRTNNRTSSPLLTNNKQDSHKRSQSDVIVSEKQVISPYIQEYVLGNFIWGADGQTKYPIREYKTSLIPNDPGSGQWWESSLNLSQAWDLGIGSSDTLLAIIDTGFALDHEEFVGRWHTNTDELGATSNEAASQFNCSDQNLALDKSCNLIDDDFDGIVDNESGTTTTENTSLLNCSDQSRTLDKSCNMIDDDSNGFIDDWRGWDFVNYDRSVLPGETNSNGSGTRHGTYVAGAAAATGNNGTGIAGVNWQTKILPVQALSDDGSGTTVSVARAIRYAVDQGADVISMSLGSAYPDDFLRHTITEAIAAGVIVVAAAGNDGCNCISYPANYEEVVAVGALDSSNARAYFSSYGTNLDVMAPGTGLYTTSWSPTNQTNAYASNIAGTSLATPLVSGALTTLKDHQPHASQAELVALLLENTDRLSMPQTTNRSNTLGFGTTDLFSAAHRALTPISHDSIISLSDIRHGQTLSSTNLEKSNDLDVYVCDFGSTAVNRLEKAGKIFYSSSLSEIGLAKANGYSAHFLGYFCSIMPHDTIDSTRLLNVFLEFDNMLIK